MNLAELKEKIDWCYEHIPNSHVYSPEDISVKITTKEREVSFGARESTTIESIHFGFDHEANQLRIETTDKIMKV